MNNRSITVRIVLRAVILFSTVSLVTYLGIKNSDSVSAAAKKMTVISAKTIFSDSDESYTTESSDINVERKLSFNEDFDETSTISHETLWSVDMAQYEIETDTEEGNTVPIAVTEVPINKDTGPLPYPKIFENHSGAIREVTYATYSSSQYLNLENGGQVRNCTKLENSVLTEESKKLPMFKITKGSDPQVLIMHTHTTESYEPYRRDYYDDSFSSRTTDPSMNIVAVGDEIAKQLESKGISVVHCTTIHDYPKYNGSYGRSEETVKAILKEYPSIKVVLDIHRDAICPENNVRVAPVVNIDGKKAAQIMIISGCDDGTMNMPNFLQNFRLASLLQQEAENKYAGLMRPVLFDYRKYNQHLTTGSLLIEVGSHANSIDEAVYSGQLFGEILASSLEKLQ